MWMGMQDALNVHPIHGACKSPQCSGAGQRMRDFCSLQLASTEREVPRQKEFRRPLQKAPRPLRALEGPRGASGLIPTRPKLYSCQFTAIDAVSPVLT
jgi:hypothetical protein